MTSNPLFSWRRDLGLLTLLFGALFFFRLGSAPLANPDEGRYAEIPREMVATGDWITPRLDGVDYFEKPPLVYWATAACLELFGPSEWSMRLTPALFGIGGVLLTYAAGRRLYGRYAGLWAAAALGTSLLYYALAHLLLLDLAVSVFMSAALFCFILGVGEPPGGNRRLLFYGLYASAALATLTKGMIGFLVPGAVMFLWLLCFDQWKRLRPLYLPNGIILFLAIALPWHLLVAAHNPTWVHRYLVYEQWERFWTPVAGRVQPIWFFIPVVILGLFPWTGFLWGALREKLAGGWARRGENSNAWFLVTWAAFIFLFFSGSHSKLIPYILPVFPPLAVLIGARLANPAPIRAGLWGFVALSGLFGAAALAVALKPDLIHNPMEGMLLRPHAWRVAISLLAGGAVVAWMELTQGPKLATIGLFVVTGLFFFALSAARPFIKSESTKELAFRVRELAGPSDEIVNYHQFFHDFAFYSGRMVDVVAFKGELEPEVDPSESARARFIGEPEFRRRWAGPKRVFAVARRPDVRELFDDPGFHYRLLGESRGDILFDNQ